MVKPQKGFLPFPYKIKTQQDTTERNKENAENVLQKD